MNTEKRNPFKRDQALNDATSGQMGGERKSDDVPGSVRKIEIPGRKLHQRFPRMNDDTL